jgi:hypothetical protein
MKLSLKKLFLEDHSREPRKKLTLESAYFSEEPLKEQPKDDILVPRDEMILKGMESSLEDEINKSVDLEESVTLDEKMSAGGFAYETTVIKALRQAKATGNITKGAGASAAAADADMNIFGNIFDVEIKLNKNAQMGGSSVRYNKAGGINLVKQLEEDTESLLIKAVKSKSKELNSLLDYLAQQDPNQVNARAIKFPMTCTRDAWDSAAQAKKLVNAIVPLTANFIAKHYAKKGIYYIQIGGAGLFFLSENPANLPVPKLQGNVNVEIRSARSGTKQLASGLKVVSGGIRVQGRLKTKNQSPYTLDDPKSIKLMLAAVEDKRASTKRKRTKKRSTKRKTS